MPLSPSLIALDKHTGRLVAHDDEKISSRRVPRPMVVAVAGPSRSGRSWSSSAAATACATPSTPSRRRAEHWRCCRKPGRSTATRPSTSSATASRSTIGNGDKRKHRGNHDDWTYLGPNEIIGTPVFYNNRVYVAVGRTRSRPRTKGGLFCIDATQTGDITNDRQDLVLRQLGRSLRPSRSPTDCSIWPTTSGRSIAWTPRPASSAGCTTRSADIWSSTLVADGKVYVGTRRHFCVLAAGRQKQLLAEVRLGSQVRSTPAVADGVLYVASQRYLWAVQLDQAPRAGQQSDPAQTCRSQEPHLRLKNSPSRSK